MGDGPGYQVRARRRGVEWIGEVWSRGVCVVSAPCHVTEGAALDAAEAVLRESVLGGVRIRGSVTRVVSRTELFADTVARPMVGGKWALMNRQDTGLAASAIEFRSLEDIVARFAVTLGERGTDKYGEFIRVLRA